MKLKELHGVPVAMWGYEQAFSTNDIISFERDDEWMEIEKLWARTFGTYPDNKTTYKIASSDGVFYITFHDSSVYIGTGVRPYHGHNLPSPKLSKQT